ncbi:MAG: asparaginase [SAR324 cluster bacterium]|jgi:L-asparaginase II|nr:asparaginase [SAR324 cluster bacterium]|tara:strand:- start:9296 stop:10297 length:1002 start_codon:yes stop_codon:yes gene_type:complete
MKNHFRDPICVEVTRAGSIESQHQLFAVLMQPDGKIKKCWGDPEMFVFPRSAVKPLQAMALVSSGAVEKYDLSSQEIALACASHGGEPVHVEVVKNWLSKVGLNPSDLECGFHWPSHQESAHKMIAEGYLPQSVHNNCSGKHSGFLTLALQMGHTHEHYVQPDHPVQLRIQEILEKACDVDLSKSERAIDGCSVPTWAIPLKNLALGMARWGTGVMLDPKLSRAAEVISKAMALHPYMVAGQGRCCTRVLRHFQGKVLVKTGAEGVYCAVFPELGLGLALKCLDGQKRASEAALVALIRKLGMVDEQDTEILSPSIIRNHNQILVGGIRVVVP